MSRPRLRRGVAAGLASLALAFAASAMARNAGDITDQSAVPPPAEAQEVANSLSGTEAPSGNTVRATEPPGNANVGSRETTEPAGAPAAEPEAPSGLLGRSLLTDLLVLAATALVGAITAILAVWSASGDRRKRELVPIHLRLDRLGAEVDAIAASRRREQSAAAGRSGARQDGIDSGYRLKSDDFGVAGGSPPPAPRQPSRIHADRDRAMMRSLDQYKDLVAVKGTKPRQFAQILAAFPDVRSLDFDGVQRLTAVPYRENDGSQALLAVGDGQRFAVLPTYDYVADFPIAFAAAAKNPEIVKYLFELNADDSGQLRVEQPAVIEVGEAGDVRLADRGRLAGFTR